MSDDDVEEIGNRVPLVGFGCFPLATTASFNPFILGGAIMQQQIRFGMELALLPLRLQQQLKR